MTSRFLKALAARAKELLINSPMSLKGRGVLNEGWVGGVSGICVSAIEYFLAFFRGRIRRGAVAEVAGSGEPGDDCRALEWMEFPARFYVPRCGLCLRGCCSNWRCRGGFRSG